MANFLRILTPSPFVIVANRGLFGNPLLGHVTFWLTPAPPFVTKILGYNILLVSSHFTLLIRDLYFSVWYSNFTDLSLYLTDLTLYLTDLTLY